MNDNISDDEINLLEILKVLWDGKWIIVMSALIASLCGMLYVDSREKSYKASIYYSVQMLPPFFNKDVVVADLENSFYTKASFEEWQIDNKQSKFSFTDISPTTVLDGVEVSKNEGSRIFKFQSGKKKNALEIKSSDLVLLDHFFSYLSYNNTKITNAYEW